MTKELNECQFCDKTITPEKTGYGKFHCKKCGKTFENIEGINYPLTMLIDWKRNQVNEPKIKLKKHKSPRIIVFFAIIIAALALVAYTFWDGLIELAEYLSDHI